MAKKSSVKCPKCDRSFKMQLHLSRHMAAAHRTKPTVVRQPRITRPAKPKARAPRLQTGPKGLLGNVRALRDDVAAQHAHLGVQLAALDQLLATLGIPVARINSAPASKGKQRAGGMREGSLKSHIDQVLRAAGQPLRVAQITDAVLKAGYATKNKTLAKSVGIALAEMGGVKKIGRGTFQAK